MKIEPGTKRYMPKWAAWRVGRLAWALSRCYPAPDSWTYNDERWEKLWWRFWWRVRP